MFSFFDKRSMEATDLNVLLAEIKELLIKVSFIKFPMVHLGENEVYCFLYLDFSQLYHSEYHMVTDLKIEAALKDLVQLNWVAHCYEDYLKTFNDAITMVPFNDEKLKGLSAAAIDDLDIDLDKALTTLDASRAAFQDKYILLQIQIAKYLHHLLFLEINCTLEPHYFAGVPAAGELFNPLMIDALTKRGVFTDPKHDIKNLQDKIISRHQQIATHALSAVYIDCRP